MEGLTLAAALALTGLIALVISWGCMEALLTALGRLTCSSHDSRSHHAKAARVSAAGPSTEDKSHVVP